MKPRLPPPCVVAARQYAAQDKSVAGFLLSHQDLDWSLYLSPEQLARAEAEVEEHKKTWVAPRASAAPTKKKAS